jgi:uncharacterized integral membrane protein
MLRIGLAVLLTAALVAFAVANADPEPVSLVVGAPLHVPQIVLLLSAVGAGIVGTLLTQQYRRAARRHAARLEGWSRPKRRPSRAPLDEEPYDE